jgi:alpha-L-rhamnosidase
MKKLLFVLLLLIAGYHSCFGQNGIVNDKAVFQSSLVKPGRIIKLSKGHYFIDFGKDAFGTLSLVAKLSQTDTLVIHLGEKLSSSNTIDRNPAGTIRYQKVILQGLSKNKPYLL